MKQSLGHTENIIIKWKRKNSEKCFSPREFGSSLRTAKVLFDPSVLMKMKPTDSDGLKHEVKNQAQENQWRIFSRTYD